jgi:hypothetical protein
MSKVVGAVWTVMIASWIRVCVLTCSTLLGGRQPGVNRASKR